MPNRLRGNITCLGSASKPFRLSIPKLPKLLQRGRRFTAPVTPLSKDDSSRCVRYTRLSRGKYLAHSNWQGNVRYTFMIHRACYVARVQSGILIF